MAGSAWNIWDLHFHTPYSVLNNGFGDPNNNDVWERYINEIETVCNNKGIVAIGITDYFTIEGYTRLKEEQEKGRLENILLIPNIEFRLDTIIEGARANFHLIISPEISIEDINDLLNEIRFFYQDEPSENAQQYALNRKKLEEFGALLKEQHKSFRGSDFEIGCMNAVVSLAKIKEILSFNRNKFYGNYLLVLDGTHLSALSWDTQIHPIRKGLTQSSHAVFSSNERDRVFYLGKANGYESEAQFIEEFKSLKPCFWGSDCHSFDQRFLEPNEEKYCWIKGDVTWNGLKQTLYEPSERIAIQKDTPESRKSIYTLSSVEISQKEINHSLKIKKTEIELNQNLIAIIGGRGSGKTALLDYIACCYAEGRKLVDIENSFYARICKDGSCDLDQKIDIGFTTGQSFSKNLNEEDIYFSESDITYLTQNHFDEFSSNPRRLNKHIFELIFSNYHDEEEEYREFEERSESLQNQIQELNLKAFQIIDQISGEKDRKEDQYKELEGVKKDLKDQLDDFEKNQEVDSKKVEELNGELEVERRNRRLIEDSIQKLSTLFEVLNNYSSTVINELEELNLNYEKLGIEKTSSLESFTKFHEQLIKSFKESKENLVSLKKSTDGNIESKKKEIASLGEIDKKLAEIRKKISDNSIDIENNRIELKEIEENEKIFKQLIQERDITYEKLIKQIIEKQRFLSVVISDFEKGKDELLDHLIFHPFINIDFEQFIDGISERIDSRSISKNSIKEKIAGATESLTKLLNKNKAEGNQDNLEQEIKECVDNLRKLGEDLISKKRTGITNSDFYNVVYKNIFSIELYIKYHEKPIETLSMGERAIVLLIIMLCMNDHPLLIDQPEEDLDNRFIYEELSPAFREAKKRRQIIIATHNANLVVNTDAEQIIIANNDECEISYHEGTIENLEIREEVKTILEGGELAFKKREERYGMIF